MKKLLIAMALGAAAISPAYAGSFTITGGTTIDTSTVPQDDFQKALINAGYTSFNYGGTLDVASGDLGDWIAIEAKGAESGYTDSLNLGGSLLVTENCSSPCIMNGGDQSATANNMFIKPGVSVTVLSGVVSGDLVLGGIDALSFTTSGPSYTATNGAGDLGWGVFFNPNDLSSVVIGYDDGGAGPDGNHDDFQLKLSVVPEPGTWALMIAGFAFLGWMQRRRMASARV